MMPRYAITTVLALMLAAVAAAIGWETDWGRRLHADSPPPPSGRVATLDNKILPAFALPPIDANYKETVERPLFIPTRRPAPAGAASQTAMKKGQFKLAGTTVSAGVSVAYLFEAATNKTHRVNLGQDINGINVSAVETSRVVLKQGEDSEELSLRTSSSPKVLPTQVAAVSPVPGSPGQPGQPGQPQPMVAGAVTAAMPMVTATAALGSSAMPPGPGAGSPSPVSMPNAPGLPRLAPGNAENAAPSTDPNAAQTRRRRFQNLPQ